MKKLIVQSIKYKGALIGTNDVKFNNIINLTESTFLDDMTKMYGRASRLFFTAMYMDWGALEELQSNLKFKEEHKSTTRKFLNRVMS